MERVKKITKNKFYELVERLLANYQVIAPVNKDGRVFYEYISNSKEVDMEYKGHTLLPPKKFFFPEKEVLFTYEKLNGDIIIYDKVQEIKEGRRVFLGIRPCDIMALKSLDKVLISEFKDPYYQARRENTIIIGLTCNEPTKYCFCAFTKTGPSINEGYDLLLTDLGHSYIVSIGSEKGLTLVKLNLDLFEEPSEEELKERDEILKTVEKEILKQELPDLTNIYEAMLRNFNAEIWKEYGEKCLACGKCNYTCPTCRCFDIFDDPNLDFKSGKRVRVWDSCHFLSFTKVTSGEIFRKERPSRVKQRIYHKYCYSIYDEGSISCVGCGRCIDVCPAKIDIREVARKVVSL